MHEAWRWFGPNDPVSLDDVRQAGAAQIVTALHQTPIGEAWTRKDIEARKTFIEAGARSPLAWTVVESIPVPDDVKRLGAAAKTSIDAWIASTEALAASEIRIVCYNFMPVVDWYRTDLEWELPNGARALRFDQTRFAAFELFIVERPGAAAEYSAAMQAAAQRAYEAMTAEDIEQLVAVVAKALPGSTSEPLTIPAFREKLAAYRDIDAAALRSNLVAFLEKVAPVAEALGVRLALHPDDPPRPLFGLPRIASSAEDYSALFDAVPSQANGICFCTGSLGVRSTNDLPGMARRFGKRIPFAHLRATRREADGSFHESDHLDGDVDMVAVLKELLREDRAGRKLRRSSSGWNHGHRMLDDLSAAKRTNPGYTAIGRLRGLAELRGAIRALEHNERG